LGKETDSRGNWLIFFLKKTTPPTLTVGRLKFISLYLNNNMAIDYISTLPWNDPYNPWPSTTQVFVSSFFFPPKIYNLQVFNPYATGTNLFSKVVFHGQEGSVAGMLTYGSIAGIMTWSFGSPFMINSTVTFATERRQIPVCYPGGPVVPWQGPEPSIFGPGPTPQQLATVTIVPLLSAVAPWERKRIIGGTG